MMQIMDVLQRGDVVAATPLAPGFPVWLPYGTHLMENLEELFRSSLRAHLGIVDEFDVELLFAEKEYNGKISSSLTYSNMYSLEFNRSRQHHLLRPDNLISAADRLRHSPVGETGHRTVLACGSLWRSDTARLSPLIRDRHIWRAIEAVTQVTETRHYFQFVETLLYANWQVIVDICQLLALPQLYYRAPGLRDHSSSCLLSLAIPDAAGAELTSTIFQLARSMSLRLALDGTLIDLGVTAKLLAMALVTGADRHGLMLTSAIAPARVVVGYRSIEDRPEAARTADRLDRAVGRVTVDDRPWSQTLRTARRRGVPLTILVDGDGTSKLVHRATNLSEDLAVEPERQVVDALLEHDAYLRRHQQTKFIAALEASSVLRIIESGEPVPATWAPLGYVKSWDGWSTGPLGRDDQHTLISRVKRFY